MIENIMKISINNETGQIMIQVPDGLGLMHSFFLYPQFEILIVI